MGVVVGIGAVGLVVGAWVILMKWGAAAGHAARPCAEREQQQQQHRQCYHHHRPHTPISRCYHHHRPHTPISHPLPPHARPVTKWQPSHAPHAHIPPMHHHARMHPSHRTASSSFSSHSVARARGDVRLRGWFDWGISAPENDEERPQGLYCEQYAANTVDAAEPVAGDGPEAALVRPLLHSTQLHTRPLQVVYRAEKDGWSARAFHGACDGKGAAIVLAKTSSGLMVGGYNPKGWASMGGARPSVAAFCFAGTVEGGLSKLRKVGGGGLAVSTDAPDFGISFGPDALVIPLSEGRPRIARSKLGPYYERGPNQERSLFSFGQTGGNHVGRGGGEAELVQLTVLVGVYEDGEDVPYTGAVLDMTSG